MKACLVLQMRIRQVRSVQSLPHLFPHGSALCPIETLLMKSALLQLPARQDLDSGSRATSSDAIAGSSDVSSYEIIPDSSLVFGRKAGPVLPVYLLKGHTRNAEFQGRGDILSRLEQALIQDTAKDPHERPSGPKIFAISGLGGMGKTHIAEEFALSRQAQFDAVFWVHADNPTKLDQAFGDIARALGLEQNSTDLVVSKELVLDWLSRPATQPPNAHEPAKEVKWLIIFDNADDLTILRDYLPSAGTGSIIVTSRDPKAKDKFYFPVSDGVDLDGLSTKDAAQLLRKLTGFNDADEDKQLSEEIAAKLGGLPLAIVQIAGTVRRKDLSFDEFLELYTTYENRGSFYESNDGNIVSMNGANKTIFATWALEDLKPEVASLLDMMAFLDPDHIPERLFTQVIRQTHNDGAQLRIPNFPRDTMAFVDARTELARSSLVKRNIRDKELSVHRLIQDATLVRMHPERMAAVFQSTVVLLTRLWPFSTFDHSTEFHPLRQVLFPHVKYLHAQYKMIGKIMMDLETRRSFARLLVHAGW